MDARTLLFTIVVLTCLLAALEYGRQSAEEARRDRELAETTAATMEGAMEGTLATGSAVVAVLDDEGGIPQDRFELFASSVVGRPGVVSIATELYVPAEERDAVEAELGIPVWERAADGSEIPAGARDAYMPVVQAWPEEYSTILGFDLLSDPVRAEAVQAARDVGIPAMTSPVELAASGSTGVLVVVPLYDPGMPTDTVEERRRAFSGVVTVGHLGQRFLQHMVIQPDMRVRLTDDGQLLTQTSDPPPPDDPGAEATAQVGGRTWTFQVRHPVRASMTNVWWILAVGLGLAVTARHSFRQAAAHVDELREARDQLARMLSRIQHGSLRAPPAPPDGMDIAVRYLPAAEHALLGGDWYDVALPDDGRVIVTVGDVSGHGINAITHMQQVRQVISAFAFEGHGPATVLRLADDVLRHEPMVTGHFATVWLGYLDPSTGRLRYAVAGHPPALVSPPGGEATPLDGQPGAPLNLPVPAGGWQDHEADLPAGSSLLVYTDGLVESRTDGFDAGVARARTVVADHDESLETLADRLMAARPDPGRDDTALILLRLRTPVPALPSDSARPLAGGRPAPRLGVNDGA